MILLTETHSKKEAVFISGISLASDTDCTVLMLGPLGIAWTGEAPDI
jgi:hypothetical protein